jgi:protein-tyrosine phosphatase
VIDLHCHVLFGIDDGPQTFADTLALARAAAAGGTRTIVATPHVAWDCRNDAAGIAALVDEVNTRLADEGVEVEVRRGAEIAMTIAGDLPEDELAALTLGGGRWLLIEPPFTPIVTGIDRLVADLQDRGYGVVIAHPERCPAFHRDRRPLEALVAGGALCSITAGSLTGRFGKPARAFAEHLVRDELVHDVASDAHDAVRRPPTMAAEIGEARLEPLADWLTLQVPAAILASAPIPPRPAFALGGRIGGLSALLRRGKLR